MTIKKQQGFTIVELMIALFLGMIILTAVVQVYIMSTRTAVVQQSGSNVLDANVFGLQKVETNLRLAGLDLSPVSISTENESGIITSTDNLKDSNMDASLVTRTGGLPTLTSRTSSDQLTIQYRAPTDMRDCEGHLALGEKRGFLQTKEDDETEWTTLDRMSPIPGQLVVERYFLADTDNDGKLELRCDSGRFETIRISPKGNKSGYQNEASFSAEQTTARTQRDASAAGLNMNFAGTDADGNGALIAKNVDDFKVLLAVAEGNNTRYLTPTEYASNTHNQKAIIAVKLGILTKGDLPTMQSDISITEFDILGEKVTLKDTAGANYIRRVFESNSMLRNSRDREKKGQ